MNLFLHLPFINCNFPFQQGDTVFTVVARDGDMGVNDSIIYSIVSGNELINETYLFIIDNETGVISVNISRLDRETDDEHTLVVQVSVLNC